MLGRHGENRPADTGVGYDVDDCLFPAQVPVGVADQRAEARFLGLQLDALQQRGIVRVDDRRADDKDDIALGVPVLIAYFACAFPDPVD